MNFADEKWKTTDKLRVVDCFAYPSLVVRRMNGRMSGRLSEFVAHEPYDGLLVAAIGQGRMHLLLCWCVSVRSGTSIAFCLAMRIGISWWRRWRRKRISADAITMAKQQQQHAHYNIYVFSRIESRQFDASTSSFIGNYVKRISSHWMQLFSCEFSRLVPDHAKFNIWCTQARRNRSGKVIGTFNQSFMAMQWNASTFVFVLSLALTSLLIAAGSFVALQRTRTTSFSFGLRQIRARAIHFSGNQSNH